jgi:hypothetical protein
MNEDTNKADVNNLGYIASVPGSSSEQRDSDSWITPQKYADMAHEVMGGIDLDPFSSPLANTRIRANRFFDIEEDAHKQSWFDTPGTVFMNPPYSRGNLEAAIKRFIFVYSQGLISEAIVLVNNTTETVAFQAMSETCTAMCLKEKRISFETDDDKNKSSNTRGQVFFYFGNNPDKFNEVFNLIGTTFTRMN